MDRPHEDARPDEDRTREDKAAVPPLAPVGRPAVVRPAIEPDPDATDPASADSDSPTEAVPAVDPDPTGPVAAPVAPRGNRTWAMILTLGIIAVVLVTAGAVARELSRRTPNGATPAPTVAVTSTAPRTTTAPVAPVPTMFTPTPPSRPADALRPWADRVGAVIGVPPVAVQAYAYAQLLLQGTHPQCHLGWTTLAGIGEVRSRHGQADGTVLEQNGRTAPVVLGPPQDGKDGHPLAPDTDAGAYDGDADFDRNMGPLLLPPAIWRQHASDADNDHIQDPYDIDDASLALGRLLCSANQDLGQLTGWTAAVGQLQAGEAFARDVFQVADSYGQRTKNVE